MPTNVKLKTINICTNKKNTKYRKKKSQGDTNKNKKKKKHK
jgi:hypothetical protein